MFTGIDKLTAIVEDEPWALLTAVDRDGSLHTGLVKSLRAPFRGQVWLDAAGHIAADDDALEGAEVSVTFGDAARGPYVSLSGWAVVLREPCMDAGRGPHPKTPRRLLCVTARAAQLWEKASSAESRIFAFPALHTRPADVAALPLPFMAGDRSGARASMLQSHWSDQRSSARATTGR